jgi:hypothetical protein
MHQLMGISTAFREKSAYRGRIPVRLNPNARLHIISRSSSNRTIREEIMGLRKVTFFDKEGTTLVPVDEDGQAKPAVMGVRWVNPDTFETIRVHGGKRTGPKNEVLMEVPPTLDTSAFAIEDLPPPKVKEELKEIEAPAAPKSTEKP